MHVHNITEWNARRKPQSSLKKKYNTNKNYIHLKFIIYFNLNFWKQKTNFVTILHEIFSHISFFETVLPNYITEI